MCNNANMQVLYSEVRDNYEPGYFRETDSEWIDGKSTGEVVVILSKWTRPEMSSSDHFLLEKTVRVDSKVEVNSIKAYSCDTNEDSQMIRLAIAAFDQLCAAHPDPKINKGGGDQLSK